MPELLLHVSRPVRWDSDHVVILNDSVQMLAEEVVWADAVDRVHVGLDYFDASINRIGAYVIGLRATQKAFLKAFLSRSNACAGMSSPAVFSNGWRFWRSVNPCRGAMCTTISA